MFVYQVVVVYDEDGFSPIVHKAIHGIFSDKQKAFEYGRDKQKELNGLDITVYVGTFKVDEPLNIKWEKII